MCAVGNQFVFEGQIKVIFIGTKKTLNSKLITTQKLCICVQQKNKKYVILEVIILFC